MVGALFQRGGARNIWQLCTPPVLGPVERPRTGVRQGWFCNQVLLLQPDIATGCFEVSTGWRCKGARAKPRRPQQCARKEHEFLSKFKAQVSAVITFLFAPWGRVSTTAIYNACVSSHAAACALSLPRPHCLTCAGIIAALPRQAAGGRSMPGCLKAHGVPFIGLALPSVQGRC